MEVSSGGESESSLSLSEEEEELPSDEEEASDSESAACEALVVVSRGFVGLRGGSGVVSIAAAKTSSAAVDIAFVDVASSVGIVGLTCAAGC